MASNSNWHPWAGRVLTGLPALGMLASAGMKLSQKPEMVANFQKFGFAPGLLTPIAVVELLCTILYLIPRTAALGAILLTGYLGGAVVTHLRAGEPVFAPIILGILVWGGLFARDSRVRALIPLRGPEA